MYLIQRLMLWLSPVIWVVGLELIKYNYKLLWLITIILLIYLVVATWVVCKFKFNKTFFQFLILPLVFSIAAFIFILFLVNTTAFHIFVVLVGVIIYLLLQQYLLYFNFPVKYQPYSLESLTFYASLLTFFFLFSSGFAALVLIKLNIIVLLLITAPLVGLIIYQFFWIHKVDFSKSWLFVLIILLVILELIVAVSYLPTSYYVNAFILVACCYLMLGLSKIFVTSLLTKKKVASYLIVASILLIMIVGTAKWN